MTYLEVDGGRLYYETAGSGAPVVFLHGFSLDARMWADQAAVLAARFTVIAYDLRGFGRSSLPAGPFTHTGDLCALLDGLGLTAAHLVGLSLGGGVAVDFALAHLERVLSLTAVDAALGGFPWTKDWSGPGRTARSAGVPAARELWLADELFAPALEQPAAAARLRQMVADYSGWGWLNRSPELPPAGGPAYDRLGAIRAPALVIVGERDLPDFQRIAEHLAAQTPGARLVRLPGAGHMSNLEAPAAFNAALLDFLDHAATS